MKNENDMEDASIKSMRIRLDLSSAEIAHRDETISKLRDLVESQRSEIEMLKRSKKEQNEVVRSLRLKLADHQEHQKPSLSVSSVASMAVKLKERATVRRLVFCPCLHTHNHTLHR